MMKHLINFTCIIIFVFSLLSFSIFSVDTTNAAVNVIHDIDTTIDGLMSPEHVSDEIMVKFRDGIDAPIPAKVHSRTGARIKKEFKRLKNLQLVTVPQNISLKQALRTYLQDSNVEYAEPNYIVHAAVTPDDIYFGNLWGLHNTGQTGGTPDADIDAPEAWDITTGSDSVIIAVVDTGVASNHPDLIDNIWTNTGETSCSDGIDNDGNGYIDDCHGWDFIGNDNDPTDYYGHGTHVAGTIAANGNNSLGITGVMWQAKIMPLRFLGVSGSGTTADAISAILYASNMGAHVINNSWGGDGFSQALKDAIDASPAVVVCATGNSGADNDASPFYPASYTSANIISVAATDHNDALASFSNYGTTTVDIAAPGVSIYSTIPQFNYGSPVTLYIQDFNAASGNLPLSGWSKGGANSTWAITAGTGVGGTNSLEDSPGNNYLSNTYSWAGYMTPVTSVKDNLYTLSFQVKATLQSNYDYRLINYSLDGTNWDWVDFRTGSTGGSFISDSTNAITFAADIANSFYFGFGLYSDLFTNYDGVYIDNVVLTRKTISIGSYGYASYQGTSMAAPHVSGVAGLLKAFDPGLNNIEIKNAILNSADPISSLSGKVLTGGRLNAFAALNSVLCPYEPVSILRMVPAYYTTLQAAYDAAGDGETIQSQALAFTENIDVDLNKSVTMYGGYNCDYTNGIGMTTVNGSVNISNGSLTLGNFILQ
jgi:subtilisin family serine protease